jgi:acetylornithine/succinyldiaminopimelate/putrescine aminotransferase
MGKLEKLFLKHVAQTSGLPMMLDISHAEGVYLYDRSGKRYFDMNSGISVNSLGHRHPAVIKAIKTQLDLHLHTMVYGEHIHMPQVKYAKALTDELAKSLDMVYFLNSGTEATEAAMKLAKRLTGRTEIVCCKNAYHGSTQGAESLRSDEKYKRAFYPLLPDIRHIEFNSFDDLEQISNSSAAIILEPVQAEAGIITPKKNFLKAVRDKCNETGALMILDEIQTGFGRTGALFAHQKYDVVPDIMLIGKAMGGGIPISAIVSSRENLLHFTKHPALGHITTFGGHPLGCAAAIAVLDLLKNSDIISKIPDKVNLIIQNLNHPLVKEIRHSGLMMAVELTRKKYLKHVIKYTLEHGLMIDWFLFNDQCFRLAPPLIITKTEIIEACQILVDALNYSQNQYK